MSGFQLGVIGALFLSVASSVSIVICNKALMSNLGFPFGNYFFPSTINHEFVNWAFLLHQTFQMFSKYVLLLGIQATCFQHKSSFLIHKTKPLDPIIVQFTIPGFVFMFFSCFVFLGAATTLTSWHLMVTFCTLHVAQRFNVFESKSVDMKTVMLFGILNGVSIGLLNLSLGFNSIGFYQVQIFIYILDIIQQ